MGGYKITTLQIKTHSFGWNKVRKSFLEHVGVSNVTMFVGFQLLTLRAGWSLSGVIFSPSPRSFQLPVCLLSAATSFLSPWRVSFPFFRVLFCCKVACLSLAVWVVCLPGMVSCPQFLNLSLLWCAVSAPHRALSLSAPSLVFLLLRWFGSFTQSAEMSVKGL